MIKITINIVLGLIVWLLSAAIGNQALRASILGYAEVESTMAFTLTMLWLRLLIGLFASLLAGGITGYASPAARSGLTLGSTFLILFGANHYVLWDKFPIWFHMVFLLSLIPATFLGSHFGSRFRRLRPVTRK